MALSFLCLLRNVSSISGARSQHALPRRGCKSHERRIRSEKTCRARIAHNT
jgi:hypothetical protein